MRSQDSKDSTWFAQSQTCAVCGCVLDQMNYEIFICDDIRCQRTWEDQVDAAEDRRINRIKKEQEY